MHILAPNQTVNRTVEMVNKSTTTGKIHGGVHYVSTHHSKVASNMGILPSTVTNYSGYVAAANRGSLHHVRAGQMHHQQVIPKTFPSVLPGGDIIAGGQAMIHPHAPPGVVAVTPHTMQLGLPIQRLLHASHRIDATPRVQNQQLDIYNYTSHQDFRHIQRQRVSGIYEWLQKCSDNQTPCNQPNQLLCSTVTNNNTRSIGINTDEPLPALGSLYIPQNGDANPQAHRQGFQAMPKLKLHLYQSKSFNKLNKLENTNPDSFKAVLSQNGFVELSRLAKNNSIRSKTQRTQRHKKPVLRMYSFNGSQNSPFNNHTYLPFTNSITS